MTNIKYLRHALPVLQSFTVYLELNEVNSNNTLEQSEDQSEDR